MHKAKHNIGLYFGSFNPVHVGHLALANYLVENSAIDELWFVVSPQNPHKHVNDLLDAQHRVKMLQLAIEEYDAFKVCTIELDLPTPSYSYKTLRELSVKYPHYQFTLIMGGDNLPKLSIWKNADEILNNYSILVYPRPNYPIDKSHLKSNIMLIEAPVFNIDSTAIRKGLHEGKRYPYLIPSKAYQYIVENKLY
jgi:nicotinate-nucleotide adenylyltransferase